MRRPRSGDAGSPSPLVGEGGERILREPGEGANSFYEDAPSPDLASQGHPLPKGERESKRAQNICVARIGAVHGVRGAVKLWPFVEDPLALPEFGALATKDGARSFEIASLRAAKDHLVATFKGIDDRDAAAGLNGIELYVPRDALPPADEGEYYHADLIGLNAVDESGATLGRVIAMHNFGAGDIIEIAPPSGPTLLLPFTDAVVPTVDLVNGYVVIVMPSEIEGEDPAA